MGQLDFFNTIKIAGYELSEAIKAVELQNDRVLEIFREVDEQMTPLQVHRVYCKIFPPCPATSIRRSITTLTDKGILIKLDKQKIEQYGSKNHFWKLNKLVNEQH